MLFQVGRLFDTQQKLELSSYIYIYIVASFYFISTAFNGGSVAHIFNRFGSSLLSCACRQGYKVVTKPFLKHVIFSVDMCSLQLGFPAGQLEITAKRKDSLRNHAACEALKKGGNFALSLSLSRLSNPWSTQHRWQTENQYMLNGRYIFEWTMLLLPSQFARVYHSISTNVFFSPILG